MATVKPSSTNYSNKLGILTKCPVTFTLSKIGGRWKPLILWNLASGTKRYHELKKGIPSISEKMLIQHLKQLEQDKLIIRKALPVIPPYVEYSLTRAGKEMEPILSAMARWGAKNSRD
jgi:DNA-binding HxlR family transcriptional regulator